MATRLFASFAKQVTKLLILPPEVFIKRLQAQGYIVETSRKDPCRVERVYYHITDEGRLALQEMIEDYHLVADATAAILNFHKDEDASADKAN